jgi:hypothetical protein
MCVYVVDEMTRKGSDRLEQLKKWKQEREMKRKLEEAENRRKNPVFRVSKAVDHGDKILFKKSGTKVSFRVNFMKQYTKYSDCE